MSLVSFVKIRGNEVANAIEESLKLIGFKFQKDAQKIVIKANMCYYWDSSIGQTTDPKFVGALIDVIRKNTTSNPKISIVESDASAMKCKHAFKFLGYEKLAQKYNVSLVNLSEDKYDNVKVTAGGQSFNLMVPHTIKDADLKINVTKIKYSLDKIKITCALKNIFGCNPYPKKFKYHPKLDEAIVAINKAMKFDLCLVDGNIVSGASPCRLGLVMAGVDSVAVDVAAARIAGVNPRTIKYIQLAQKEGLGSSSFTQVGVPLDYFRARYPKKDVRKKLMSKAYDMVVLLKLAGRLGLE